MSAELHRVSCLGKSRRITDGIDKNVLSWILLTLYGAASHHLIAINCSMHAADCFSTASQF